MIVVQVVALVALAPFIAGLMKRMRANFQGRPGPGVFQRYRDLLKSSRKEALLPDGVSALTVATPGVVLGIALVFAAVLPIAPAAFADPVDIVALVLLLGAGRFVTALAALDTRSSFAGMAASREMTFGALLEPTLLLALLGAAGAGGTQLTALARAPFGLPAALAVAAFFIVLLAETARVPIDDQETHYELSMIHEGLLLEFSGWQFAALGLAADVRQICFLALALVLLPGASFALHLAWLPLVLVGIVGVETVFAKMRLFEVPQLLVTAFILALAGIGLRIAGGHLL
jgi:formate hydrogenlyase subunit 4